MCKSCQYNCGKVKIKLRRGKGKEVRAQLSFDWQTVFQYYTSFQIFPGNNSTHVCYRSKLNSKFTPGMILYFICLPVLHHEQFKNNNLNSILICKTYTMKIVAYQLFLFLLFWKTLQPFLLKVNIILHMFQIH